MIKENVAGRVIAVQGPVVDVKFTKTEDVPGILSVLKTHTVDKEEVILEVAEHLPGNIARCISINSTINIKRSEEAVVTDSSIRIPTGDNLYGRIINILG